MTELEKLLERSKGLREKAIEPPYKVTWHNLLNNKNENFGILNCSECTEEFIIDAANTSESRDEMLKIAVDALENFQLGHEHAPDLKHTREMGYSYGWCDYCQEKVSWGPGIAEQALASIESIAKKLNEDRHE